MNLNIQTFKHELACAFSDNHQSKAWHHWVDRSIMVLLLLNALVIFLSTYDDFSDFTNQALSIVDDITTVIFLVEVTLRIWTADVFDSRFRGFLGRVRYCLTPYGLVDFLSTYPSLLVMFTGFSPMIFKSLRVLRLLRIFRFMKGFRLMTGAVANKRQELSLSLGFLVVVTFMLSIVLFYVEHAANPERYANGFDSVLWAFMQYIGDPGGFAENAPETLAGRVIASIVGVLGIAVFAVPAGIIGSGFIEEVEEIRGEEVAADNADKIFKSFVRKLDRATRFRTVPNFLSVAQLQVLTDMTPEEIQTAVRTQDTLRLVNLATTLQLSDNPQDRLAVIHYVKNTNYGCLIDRGSKITIVATSAFAEPGSGDFGYYLAKIGGFNYISREVVAKRPSVSYWLNTDVTADPYLPEFMADLNRLASGKDCWVFYVLAASGGMEPIYPTQVHFNFGGKRGDETYDGDDLTLVDKEKFDVFFHDFQQQLDADFPDVGTDFQRYYDTSSKNMILRKLNHRHEVNSIALRMAWAIELWDLRRYAIAKLIADKINLHLNIHPQTDYSPELRAAGIGFGDYKE